jgi:hypothetical protein
MSTLPLEQNTRSQKPSQPSRLIRSIIWGVLVFLVLSIGLEAFARTSFSHTVFPVRSLGSYHAQFEIKWFKLQQYVKQHGGVDVIILGNSMVNTGIDPDILAADYKAATGQELRIFNFGIEGLTIAPISTLAQILNDKYHPGTMLVITEIRDYSALNGNETDDKFLDNDWFKYTLGNKDVKGWLFASSTAIQTVLPFRNWSATTFPDAYFSDVYRVETTTAAGYEAEHKIGRDVDANPDPNDPQEKEVYAMFAHYTMDKGRIQDLENIIELQNQGVRVLVSEIPVYPTYYAYFGKSGTVVEAYHQQIAQIVAANGSTYLPAVDYGLIPWDGRADNHHLNDKGAPAYSQLLAQQLADLCNQQQICLQAAAAEGK